MATKHEVLDNEKLASQAKLEKIKKDMGFDCPEEALDFALRITPFGAEKITANAIKKSSLKE